MKKSRRAMAILLAFMLILGMTCNDTFVSNAKGKKYVKSVKVAKSVTVNAKKSKTVKVTVKVANKASKAMTVKVKNKKIAKASYNAKKGKLTIKGLKKGKTTVTLTTKAKNKKGKKIKKVVKITVKKASSKSSKSSSTKKTNETKEDDGRIDISSKDFTIKLYSDIHSYHYDSELEKHDYDGKAFEPLAILFNKNERVYEEGNYKVSYKNNKNAGTATVILTGIGKYKGTKKKTFKIEKVSNFCTKKNFKNKMYVGDSYTLKYTGLYGSRKFYSMNEKVATISDDGVIKAVSTGYVEFYADASGDNNHTSVEKYFIGECYVVRSTASKYGFSINSWSGNYNYYKVKNCSRNDDGTATLAIAFNCDAEEEWIDKNVTFKVTNVTPKGIKKIFKDMGYPETKIGEPKITSHEISYYGYTEDVICPINSEGQIDYSTQAVSGKRIAVDVGIDIRIIRVDAFSNGKLLDSAYVYAASAAAEDKLYEDVRHKVEKKIWTDDMTNHEKLSAMAGYINSTCHYPGTGCTNKKKNPALLDKYGVDGKDLFYFMCNDVRMNRIIDMQGGIITCQASSIISVTATDDLKLPWLYDKKTDTIAEGEGVWVGLGEYSSAPQNPGHESLIYQDANGKRTFIDAQGMMTETPCSEHGCEKNIVSLAD